MGKLLTTMQESNLKKIVIAIMVVVLLGVGTYFSYYYINGPKITDGVVSKNIDDNGKPSDIATEFILEDTVHFSAKSRRFWVKKAQVVWYKGKIATQNRFLVQEDIAVNSEGYFTVKLPEDLEEGKYSVSIYQADSNIIESSAEFDVKK